MVENRLVIAMGQAVECWWRHRGTSGDDIVVLYLDCGVCYMIACIFQNSLNYPLIKLKVLSALQQTGIKRPGHNEIKCS